MRSFSGAFDKAVRGHSQTLVLLKDSAQVKLHPQVVQRGLGPVGYHHHNGYAVYRHLVEHLRD